MLFVGTTFYWDRSHFDSTSKHLECLVSQTITQFFILIPIVLFHPPLHSKEYRTYDSITITEAENPAEPIGSLPLGSPFPPF